jgi:hypothetical protein
VNSIALKYREVNKKTKNPDVSARPKNLDVSKKTTLLRLLSGQEGGLALAGAVVNFLMQQEGPKALFTAPAGVNPPS